MPPEEEDIDALFRDGLGGHATPPDPALWNRLADHAADERLDALFRRGLSGHATPPARPLWERLEDEHLRPPRRRRAAAWGPLALAAAVALLLVAGGAGLLWRGWPSPRPAAGLAARGPRATNSAAEANRPAAAAGRAPGPALSAIIAAVGTSAAKAPAPAARSKTALLTPSDNISSTRATAADRLASSGASAAKRAAETAARRTRPAPERPVATGRPAPKTAPAGPNPSNPPPDAGALAAASVAPATASADAAQVIEVDVRHGGAPDGAVAAAPGRPAPRRLLGGLLRQAGRLARGEGASLAAAAGLPETITLQANLGGRTLTRSIQL